MQIGRQTEKRRRQIDLEQDRHEDSREKQNRDKERQTDPGQAEGREREIDRRRDRQTYRVAEKQEETKILLLRHGVWQGTRVSVRLYALESPCVCLRVSQSECVRASSSACLPLSLRLCHM